MNLQLPVKVTIKGQASSSAHGLAAIQDRLTLLRHLSTRPGSPAEAKVVEEIAFLEGSLCRTRVEIVRGW